MSQSLKYTHAGTAELKHCFHAGTGGHVAKSEESIKSNMHVNVCACLLKIYISSYFQLFFSVPTNSSPNTVSLKDTWFSASQLALVSINCELEGNTSFPPSSLYTKQLCLQTETTTLYCYCFQSISLHFFLSFFSLSLSHDILNSHYYHLYKEGLFSFLYSICPGDMCTPVWFAV